MQSRTLKKDKVSREEWRGVEKIYCSLKTIKIYKKGRKNNVKHRFSNTTHRREN